MVKVIDQSLQLHNALRHFVMIACLLANTAIQLATPFDLVVK